MLKSLERIVQWLLLEYVIKKPFVFQHAYTKGLSTETALTTFANKVEKMVHRGKKVLAVSLDCSGAFDRIKFDSAFKAMLDQKIPKCIVQWYDSILRGREVSAYIQGEQSTIVPGQGSPQGGVLSPFVWIMIMDTLLRTFDHPYHPVKVVGYADDILLYICGSDPSTMKNQMEQELNKVHKWGKNHGLEFNPTKTVVTMFERATRKVNEPTIKMGGSNLTYSDNLKYLGITFNKRCSWTNHINNKVKQCGYLLHKLRTVIGREWGLKPEKLAWIYTAMIRPRISYGAVV